MDAQSWIQALKGFATGGLQGAGVPLPNWANANALQRVLQNPDNTAAMGIMTPIRGTGVKMGVPEKTDIPSPVNQNQTALQFSYAQKANKRLDAINKIIKNEDFTPALADGKMKFKSLTRDENQVVNKIGYGRAPDVTWEMEQNDPATAWEKNVKYWRDIETPSE